MLEALDLVKADWRDSALCDAGQTGGLLNSSSFVEDEDLFASSFDNPALQLAVGLKPKQYKPEIIGMNLFLEVNIFFLVSCFNTIA